MDILHVAQPTNGGVKRVVLDFVADQSQRGLDVAVAGPTDADVIAELSELNVTHIPWEASRSPGPSVLAETRSLSKVLKRHSPKVLHLHSSKAGLAGRLASRGRIPTAFQPHGWSFLAVRGPVKVATLAWERIASRWTDAMVCVSETEKELGQQMGLKANWEVVRNGINLDQWPAPEICSRSTARQELQVDPEVPLVICVGRLQPQKGQDLLLKAWPDIVQQCPGAQLVLVGDGPDREVLESQATADVTFVGLRNDVRNWMLAADVIAMPSRWEGLSIALLEGMACGRAVVAAEVTGMREAAGSDAGSLIPPEDIPALTAEIVRLLNSPEQRVQLETAGRRRVEEEFSLTRTCNQLLNVYSQRLNFVYPAAAANASDDNV